MSSGACRALVAVLFTLVATIGAVLPVTAREENLTETSFAEYSVHPDNGTIDVSVVATLKAIGQNWEPQVWGPVIVEEAIRQPATRGDITVPARRDPLPGPWDGLRIRTPRLEAGGDRTRFSLDYTLDASVDQRASALSGMPARIDDSYIYFCVTGQDTDTGTVRVRIDDFQRWDIKRPLGTPMQITDYGYASEAADRNDPGDIFTCFEGVREERLEKDGFSGPADRLVELQAWRGNEGSWLDGASDVAPETLRRLHDFIGHDIPGEDTLIIRMAPSAAIGGYASAHDTPGIVQLDEGVGLGDGDGAEHQLAHAWYGTDNFQDVWLREGMAEWTASAMTGDACEPVSENPLELDLSEWLVVQPQLDEGWEERIAAQEAAACGIVAAVRERMPKDRWDEVVGSMLKGETKYIGSTGPEIGTSTGVDYREWLDAIDERGLVPAGADPAYADNLAELDFAQDLVARFGIEAVPSGGESELALRSQARAMYHEFLRDAGGLSAPHAVRKDMDDWEFRSAMARIEKSREVFDQLVEADTRLPEADLLEIVQPDFEAATNETELDEVAALVEDLLEGARGVEGPLGDLQAALPAGWTMPLAVKDAISERRFDDIMAAINPAILAAQYISEADAALPQADFLEQYQERFENTPTAGRLDDLVSDAQLDRIRAIRAGDALQRLETEAGDWAIPSAVTEPLENGRIQAGTEIIEDARAVVAAATKADAALPEAGLRDEFRPRFEAVTTGAEMAALRDEVVERADEAEKVGIALATLESLVPTWQIPAVVADPVAEGRFAEAVATAQAAAQWIQFADMAQASLPALNALDAIKADFEAARSLEELLDGAELAQDQAEAADWVQRAQAEAAKPRDLLTDFGLWGVDIDTIVDEAVAAAIAGDVRDAVNKSAEAIQRLDGGASSGSLRLGGIVFFAVALLGVLGLWVMLRRQAGPSWARSSTPHWIEDGRKRRLLGRGKKKGKGEKNG